MQDKKEISIEEKRIAFAEVLKRTRMFDKKEEIIERASRLPDITDNLLVSLLKNRLWQIIPFIYESPSLLLELADAGFETDPRTMDSSGKSAFFHALSTEQSHLVSLLYDHAANACSETGATVRSPDGAIVENLQSLKAHLETLAKDVEKPEISEKSKCLFRDLCRFNEFQIETCKSVNNIKLRIDCYDETEKECEALKRKQTILTILKIYKAYFDSPSQNSTTDADISRFKEFYEHKDYFDWLDFSSAVTFFDNLFLLKERLILPNDAYLNIESNFLRFIFFRKAMKQYENQEDFYFASRWIIFQDRLLLKNHLCDFIKLLEEIEVSKDNVVNKLPKSAVKTLTNLPEIYGEFFISRFQLYLNAATSLTVKDIKSILVIERFLHIMGEFCKASNFKSFEKILTLGLPTDFKKHLKHIRNHSAHIKSDELLYKYSLEKDVDLCRGIQKELNTLEKLFFPIYSAQKFEIEQFLLLICEKYIYKARESMITEEHENQLIAILPCPKFKENQLSMPTANCQTRWNFAFDEMLTVVRKGIKCERNILDENTASAYECIVQNLISAKEKKLKGLKVTDSEIAIEELDSHFWCLEQILSYVTADINCDNHRTKLDVLLKERQSLFNELKENAIQLQKTYKSTHATIGNISLANGEVGAMFSPLKPGDNHDNHQKNLNTFNPYEKYGLTIEINNFKFSEELIENAFARKSLKSPETETVENSVLPKTDFNEGYFKENVEKILNHYKKFVDTLFQEFQRFSNEVFDFKNIENYCWLFKGHTILTNNEKESLIQSVEEQFRNVPELKKSVLLKLENTSDDNLEKDLVKLNLSNNEIKKIEKLIKAGSISKAREAIESARDYFLELQSLVDKKEINKSDYELMCKKLQLSSDAKDILWKLVSGQNQKVRCNRFEFILNRIEILKNILVEENNAFKQLWEEDTTPSRRIHVKEKIIQLYLKDSSIQASIETLLFDCMIILNFKEQKHLWRKTTNLFHGVNLRNVIAHGHPLLETLGRLLDPYDLPSELVEKMLKLISDEHVIYCIQKILEETKTIPNDFMELLEDEQLKSWSEKIKNCDHYYDYAPLIKMQEDWHRVNVVSP